MNAFLTSTLCAALFLLPAICGAQYPERVINLIVAYSPGGGTDLIAREQGYDIEMSSLRGMVAPKGLPPEIRDRLVKAIERSVADPEFQAKSVQFFSPLRYLPPAQYEAIVREADVTYKALWKELPWADK